MTIWAPLGHQVRCRDCGTDIVLVQIIPAVLSQSMPRRRIPLEVTFDDERPPVAASHALTAGRRQCRPITAADPIAPGEVPALTHFAVCPARQARRHHRPGGIA